MKNKKALLIVIIFVIASLLIGYVAVNRDFLLNRFLIALDKGFDDARSLEAGDDFSQISFGANSQFEVAHHKDGNNLEYVYREKEKKEEHIILKSVIMYDICDNKLHVASKLGCAVVEERGICRICLNEGAENEFSYDRTETDYDFKVFGFQKFEHENVKYLSDFEEFSEDEKKVLKRMLK